MTDDKITPEEQAKRRWDVEQAWHSTRLEGLEPSQESLDLGEKWVRGDITIEDWLQQIKEKYQ